MMKRSIFLRVFCLLSLFGCASTNNGQTPEAAEEQTGQASSREEGPGSARETPTAGTDAEIAADPKREQAMRDCEKCNGQWGRHGLASVESCICRTSDFGKPCMDGDDCEGVCLLKDSEFKCSELVTVFGCYSYLPKGWSKRSDKDKQGVPKICLD
jgi:hypothetical protein